MFVFNLLFYLQKLEKNACTEKYWLSEFVFSRVLWTELASF